jgi:hypothetical protein
MIIFEAEVSKNSVKVKANAILITGSRGSKDCEESRLA